MEEIFKDRRKFPRIETELIVRYKVLATEEQQDLDATTKNISGGGVCLVTREKMQAGTTVAMEIKFSPMENPVLACGRVVWASESRLGPSPAGHPRFDNGIEFIEISQEDRNRIIERVKSEQEKTKDKGWNIGLITDLSE